jgi:hypothetical protein
MGFVKREEFDRLLARVDEIAPVKKKKKAAPAKKKAAPAKKKSGAKK